MTNEAYIEAAREQYQREGEIEIDDGAVVSRGSDPGAYVQGWLWVYDTALEDGGSEDDPDQPDDDTPVPTTPELHITLADYTAQVYALGETAKVIMPDGTWFEATVVSAIGHVEGLQTVTLGYGGVASELYQADLTRRKAKVGK